MGNRVHISVYFTLILLAASILFIHTSAFADVNTRLVFVSNQFNTPEPGKGTLILDMEAISDAGVVKIDTFQNGFQLDAVLFGQTVQVNFSEAYFGFEISSTPPHVYQASYSFNEGNGTVLVNCTFLGNIFPNNKHKTIGMNYQRIVRVTIEYDLVSGFGAISWLPIFYVTNQAGANITGVQEPIPPELSDIPLPVELSSFTAALQDNKVLLTWVTQSEINNQGFEVYRSTAKNGEYILVASYEDIPSLLGVGNSNTQRTYTYQDAQVIPGENYWYQIADVDYDGIRTFHGPVSAEFQEAIPEAYVLHPNYPNPFNPETNIRFEIPANTVNSKVKLAVYNNLGTEVLTLVNGIMEPGEHTLQWDGRNNVGEPTATGMYFLRLEAGNFTQTQKMLLVR